MSPLVLLAADAPHMEIPALDPEADATLLAARAATTCGDPYTLAEVAFTFVVVADGVEKVRRRHVWRPRDGTVRVSWEVESIFLEQLSPYPASADPGAKADAAYQWFTNDLYWLLAPCKALDSGVEHAVTTDGRLALSFAPGTGLTPGDRYWLTLDDEGRLVHWDYLLALGGHGSFRWEAFQRYGSLELATTRVSEEGDFVIRFEEIHVQ